MLTTSQNVFTSRHLEKSAEYSTKCFQEVLEELPKLVLFLISNYCYYSQFRICLVFGHDIFSHCICPQLRLLYFIIQVCFDGNGTSCVSVCQKCLTCMTLQAYSQTFGMGF